MYGLISQSSGTPCLLSTFYCLLLYCSVYRYSYKRFITGIGNDMYSIVDTHEKSTTATSTKVPDNEILLLYLVLVLHDVGQSVNVPGATWRFRHYGFYCVLWTAVSRCKRLFSPSISWIMNHKSSIKRIVENLSAKCQGVLLKHHLIVKSHFSSCKNTGINIKRVWLQSSSRVLLCIVKNK
jgi:hypothetical protein